MTSRSASFPIAAALAAALAATLAAACRAPQPPGPATGPAARSTTVADAAARCAALASASLPRVHITQAQWSAAGQPTADGADGAALPAHCRVSGRIDERAGADGERYHTGFELRLPDSFSGRFLHQGTDEPGLLPDAVGRSTGALGLRHNALQRGFAVVAGDGGHQGPSFTFGLDPQARIEHAWRAHWRTTTVARQLLQQHYGRDADRSYFVGCGEGGRQGMMFTQRFPELFDGVVAVAPAMSAAQGAAIAAAWSVQKLRAVAPAGGDGRPRLAEALGDAQLARIATEVLQRCDAADGIVDGIVADTALCRIDPLRHLACPAAGAGCLSQAQARALAELMAGARARGGARLAFGFPWDPGIAAPGWREWMLGTGGADGRVAGHATRTSSAIGLLYTTPPDPTLDAPGFDFDRDPQRLRAYHLVAGTADDVQLKGLVARSGRLLLFHGMADPVFPATETVDYQQRVDTMHGAAAAARFVRTFLVPGMNHCRGGPAPDDFDGLAAIVDWVEQGRAPERIVARGSQALPGIERPLCPHPRIARYRGGDPAMAASFECR